MRTLLSISGSFENTKGPSFVVPAVHGHPAEGSEEGSTGAAPPAAWLHHLATTALLVDARHSWETTRSITIFDGQWLFWAEQAAAPPTTCCPQRGPQPYLVSIVEISIPLLPRWRIQLKRANLVKLVVRNDQPHQEIERCHLRDGRRHCEV